MSIHQQPAMGAPPINNHLPPWLQDHCRRLADEPQDRNLTNLNLNIRRLDTADMVRALAAAIRRNRGYLSVLNLTSTLSNNPVAVVPLFRTDDNNNNNNNNNNNSAGDNSYNNNNISNANSDQSSSDDVNGGENKSSEADYDLLSSLRILHLSYNRIRDAGPIGHCLATNRSLVELYLDYNLIGSGGVTMAAASAAGAHGNRGPSRKLRRQLRALASGLGQNTTLRVLALSYNRLGDAGCMALASPSSLGRNRSLRVLRLAHNGVTEVGAKALESVLENSNCTLEELDLGGHDDDIPPALLARIELLCRANRVGGRRLLLLKQCNEGDMCDGCPDTLPHHLLWPIVLGRCNAIGGAGTADKIGSLDLLYYFLRRKPDMFCQTAEEGVDCRQASVGARRQPPPTQQQRKKAKTTTSVTTV